MHAFFEPWLSQAGAPEMHLRDATVRPHDTAYVLTAVVEQLQPDPAYQLHLPLAVTLEGQAQAYETTVSMAEPLRLDLDPQFDVFRRLHRREIPPALSQMFGARQALILLPRHASAELRQGYVQLAQAWQHSAAGQLEVRWDDEVTMLPTDRCVWLLGWDNRWRAEFAAASAEHAVTVSAEGVQIDQTVLSRAAHTVVLTARHPHNAQHTLAWIATEQAAALPGLGRKLPH
jgi:hypothetical protein